MRTIFFLLILGLLAPSFALDSFQETEKTFYQTEIALTQSEKHPQNLSRGIFVYTHGMTSRYQHHYTSLESLRKAGYDVVAYDLPGHGDSQRELFDINGSVRSFEQLVNVLGEVIEDARSHYGREKNVYVGGWSLGGIITTVYLQRNPHLVKAAILFTPGVSLSIIHGDLSLILGVDTEKLIHDKAKARDLEQNEAFFRFPPPSLASSLLAGYAEARFKKGDFRTPSLVLTAGVDHFAHSPGVKKFYEKATASNGVQIEYAHFPESFHDLENDVDSKDVIAKVISYLHRH